MARNEKRVSIAKLNDSCYEMEKGWKLCSVVVDKFLACFSTCLPMRIISWSLILLKLSN